MKHTSEQQQKYLAVYTAHALQSEAYAQRMKPYAYLLNDESGIDEYVDIEMAMRAEYRMDELEDALRHAEDVLIDWAFGVVENDPKTKAIFAANKSQLDSLRCRSYLLSVRSRLIEVACLLVPPKKMEVSK